MARCVVIGGSPQFDPKKSVSLLQSGDRVIAADRGVEYARQMGMIPELAIGDFDSLEGTLPDGFPVEVLPCEKDDTDLLAAVRRGLQWGCREFLLLGALGGRMDHTMAALSVLYFLEQQGCHGRLESSFCRIRMLSSGECKVERDAQKVYFSVFAYGGSARGVTLDGVRYPLKNAVLTPDFPIGCSNEIVEPFARVRVEQGTLMLMQCVR